MHRFMVLIVSTSMTLAALVGAGHAAPSVRDALSDRFKTLDPVQLRDGKTGHGCTEFVFSFDPATLSRLRHRDDHRSHRAVACLGFDQLRRRRTPTCR
jgi:hypothetical protein